MCHFGLIAGICCHIKLKYSISIIIKFINTRRDNFVHKDNWLFVHTQTNEYLFPHLGGGITQPHVIQSIIRSILSSHNHKQWTRQVSGSMTASLSRPFYWVTNRWCTDVAPVLERGTDLSCTSGTGSDGELTVHAEHISIIRWSVLISFVSKHVSKQEKSLT